MEHRIIVGFVTLISLLVLVKSQAVHRSSYGQFCNDTIKCEKRSWLSCQSSICACMLEDMVYDSMKLKCLSKSGERCRFQISENKNTFALYENTECISNANCDNGFTCSCNEGYYENIDGTCNEQKYINETCTSTAECKHTKFLICVDERCTCSKEDNHVYGRSSTNAKYNLCVGKAGTKLISNTTCIKGTSLTDGVCKCSPETKFYAKEDGFCYPRKPYGEPCFRDEECIYERQFLTCENGYCGCKESESIYRSFRKEIMVEKEIEVRNQRYKKPDWDTIGDAYFALDDRNIVYGTFVKEISSSNVVIRQITGETTTEALQQCVGLANSDCNPESNCVSDATCSVNTCICDSGFSPTSKRMCGIGYEGKCSASTPCSDLFVCNNGNCKCPLSSHQIYDTNKSKCRGVISAFCNEDSDCIFNSACLLNSKSEANQCQCQENYVENNEGKCEKGWGSTCEKDDPVPCDTVASLQCLNGFCNCEDKMTYFNSTLRKCVGLVGSRCNSSNVNNMCVYGAHCVEDVEGISGQCLCKQGYKVTYQMLCKYAVIAEEFDIAPDEEIELNVSEGSGQNLLQNSSQHSSERP